MTTSYFADEQGAAVLKHGILSRYLKLFALKTGVRSRRVAYLDGYAGAGAYESGAPGSPILAVQTAHALAGIRKLECFMVEKKPSTYELLKQNLARAGVPDAWTIRKGDVAEHLDEFLKRSAGCPVFAFFDPFGLLAPMEDIARVFQRQGTTECLLNFSLRGLERTAGKLDSMASSEGQRRHNAGVVAKANASLGGDWWQPIWRSSIPIEDRKVEIFHGYMGRLAEACGGRWYFSVPVSDTWEGGIVYFLVLLTRRQEGIWKFHEVVSSANQDFYTFTHRFDPPGMFDERTMLQMREQAWEATIRESVLDLLAEKGRSFSPRETLDRIYGSALGLARPKHIRRAVIALHNEGVVSWDGTGEIPDARIGLQPGAAIPERRTDARTSRGRQRPTR